MNNKAQKFKDYLDEKEIKVFEIEELSDEQETVAFRSRITISGQNLPTAVFIDNSDYSMVRVQIAPNALTAENSADVLKFANDETAKYNPFKLFFNDNGDLLLDFCIDANDEIFSGEKVYSVFDIIINYLENNYLDILPTPKGGGFCYHKPMLKKLSLTRSPARVDAPTHYGI